MHGWPCIITEKLKKCMARRAYGWTTVQITPESFLQICTAGSAFVHGRAFSQSFCMASRVSKHAVHASFSGSYKLSSCKRKGDFFFGCYFFFCFLTFFRECEREELRGFIESYSLMFFEFKEFTLKIYSRFNSTFNFSLSFLPFFSHIAF